MRKLLAFLLLTLPAFATTAVTGKIQTLGTSNITQGAFVRFWLRGCGGNQPRVNGQAVIGPTQGGVFYFDMKGDGNGNVAGTLYSTRDATGLGSGDIECGGNKTGVWYGMQIFDAGKGGPETPVHAINGGILNITNVVPLSTNPTGTAPGSPGYNIALEVNGTPNGSQALLDLQQGTNVTLSDNGLGVVTINSTGGGGSSILLQTNGTTNASQSILNLIPGSNVGIVDGGGGNITISSTGGGGGGGNMTTTPAGGVSQLVIQKPGTTLGTNSLSNIRYVEPSYNWTQSPADNLGTPGVNTIHLTPCPYGVIGSDASLKVWIATTGTPEAAQSNGTGSCTSGGATGTIVVTTLNAHSAGYSVQSASTGIYEAIAGVGNNNIHLVLRPAADSSSNVTYAYNIYGSMIPPYGAYIEGQGAVIICSTRDFCIGGFTLGNVTLDGVRFASTQNINGWAITNTACSGGFATITAPGHGIQVGDFVDVQDTDNHHYWGGSVSAQPYMQQVTSTTANTVVYPDTGCGGGFSSAATPGYINVYNAGFLAAAQADRLINVTFDTPGGAGITGHFNNGVVVLNDQDMTIDRLYGMGSMGNVHGPGGVPTTNCTTTNPYCGWAVYAPGGSTLAAVIHIASSTISMQCYGNGVGDFGGNTITIDGNSIIQGYSEVGVLTGNPRGGLGRSTITGLYEESGACQNPKYAQSIDAPPQNVYPTAGVINVGTPMTWTAGEGPGGGPNRFAQGGATTYYYYVVIHDSILGVSVPMYAGFGSPASTGVLVQWPRVSGSNTITYDVLRQTSITSSPYTAVCTGGSTSACGSVAVAQAQCSGLVCSFTDNVSVATTSYTVTDPPTYAPGFWFWPAGVLALNSVQDAAVSSLTSCGGTVTYSAMNTAVSVQSNTGAMFPCAYSLNQTAGGQGNSPGWVVAMQGDAAGGVQPPLLLSDAGLSTQLKGLIIHEHPVGGTVPAGEIYTLVDSSPTKSRATSTHRATADGADLYFGNDVATAALNATGLAVGCGVHCSEYVTNTPDGVNYVRQISSVLDHVVVPELLDTSLTVLGSGCISGCGPFALGGSQASDTFTRANGALGANWTVTDGTWAIASNAATHNTSGGDGFGLAAYTALTFNNNQFAQAKITFTTAGEVGVAVRMSNSVSTGYLLDGNTGSDIEILKLSAGTPSVLCTATGIKLAAGDVLRLTVFSTTLTAYKNGAQICQTTDGSIASGYPGIVGQGATGNKLINFFGGDLNWTATVGVSAVSFATITANPALTGIFHCAGSDTCLTARNAANSADITLSKNGADQWSMNTGLAVTQGTISLGGSGGGAVDLSQGAILVPVANSVQEIAPTSVSSNGYNSIKPGTARKGILMATLGTGAAGTVSCSSCGALVTGNITITSSPAGQYAYPPACKVTGGGGTGATCAVSALDANGQVTTANTIIVNGGSGYTSGATLTFIDQTELSWGSPFTVDITGRNSAITDTAFAPAAGGFTCFSNGTMRLYWTAKVTTAATTGAATSTLGPVTIKYTDPDSVAQTITAAAQSKAGAIETSDSGNSTTTVLLGLPILINCQAGTNITYAVAYASNTAAQMGYNFHARLDP